MGCEGDPESKWEEEAEAEENETTKFISKCSSSSPDSVIIIPMMSSPDSMGEGGEGEFKVTPKPNDNKEISKGSDSDRRRSSQSLRSSAHLHLQLIVEDVKEEIKELTQGGLKKSLSLVPCENGGIVTEDNLSNQNNNNCDGKELNLKKKSKVEDEVYVGIKRYLGIILAISSSSVFALGVLLVKLMPQYHPFSVSIWRFQGILLPSLPMILYYRVVKRERIFETVWPLWGRRENGKTVLILLLRGVSGAGAVTLQFYSLQYINMADSSVIVFSTPVFVSLLSHVILGEKSGFIPVLCGVIALLGVVIITRPPLLTGGEEFDTDTLIGSGLALGSMACAAATFLVLRYLRMVHFSVITAYFGVYGTLQSVTLAGSVQQLELPQGMDDWLMASALALLTFIGQTFITLAFQFEQAGTIALCRTFDILFAYFWQYLILGVVPDLLSMIGGIVVILGVLIAGLRKFIGDLPPGHPMRNKLWIMLK